jgi:hypothetical protein
VTGFLFATALCVGCNQPFTFSPSRVPVAVVNGQRLPVCRTCWDRRQAYRREHGLPAESLVPGAYDAEEA